MSDPPPPAPDAPAPAPAATPSAEAAAELVGTVLSERYRLVELVAMGGMGAVYRADHLLLRKRVAIKLLHPETKGFPEHVARFEREAIAGAHLTHPNIAAATDFGKLPDGSHFLVLEYVRGVSLDRVIQEGPMAPARAADIARQIAAALGAAHERGIVHRDVKPRNIMLDEGQSGVVKLIDFGLARVPLDRLSTPDADEAARSRPRALTLSGVVFGTVAYMAPEAAGGMDEVDERSDLYALGILLYEMLSGKHPFDAVDPVKLFQQQCLDAPPPLRLRAPGVSVPRELEAVVMRLLRKDASARYENAAAVIAALEAAMPSSESLGLISWRSPLPMPVAGALDDGPLPAALSPAPGAAAPVGAPGAAASSAAPGAGAPPGPPLRAMGGLLRGKAGRAATYHPRLLARRRAGGFPAWALAAAAAVPVVALALVVVLWLRGSSGDAVEPAASPGASGVAAAPVARIAAGGAPPVASAPAAVAAPSESDAPAGPPLAGERAHLVVAARTKAWPEAEAALLALVASDPAAFQQRDVMTAAALVAVQSEARSGSAADAIFEALSTRLGADGLDVLYEAVSGHGGTRGAERAAAVLRRPEVLARASAPLGVAMALRDAPCKAKPALFDRAAREGDARALLLLELLRSPQCQPRIGQCCFHNNADIEAALGRLRGRLGI